VFFISKWFKSIIWSLHPASDEFDCGKRELMENRLIVLEPILIKMIDIPDAIQ
jgi:hypothetical protein